MFGKPIQPEPNVQNLIERLDKWLQQNRPEEYKRLLPGLSEDEVTALQHKLGLELPEAFKSFLMWKQGQNINCLIEGYRLLSVSEMTGLVAWLSELQENGDFELENWWNYKWFPFAESASGDNFCIDMAGTFGGKPGQIISFYHDWERRTILHESFKKWLETVVVVFESGFRTYEPNFAFPNSKEEKEYKVLYSRINPGYPKVFEAGSST